MRGADWRMDCECLDVVHGVLNCGRGSRLEREAKCCCWDVKMSWDSHCIDQLNIPYYNKHPIIIEMINIKVKVKDFKDCAVKRKRTCVTIRWGFRKWSASDRRRRWLVHASSTDSCRRSLREWMTTPGWQCHSARNTIWMRNTIERVGRCMGVLKIGRNITRKCIEETFPITAITVLHRWPMPMTFQIEKTWVT